MASAINNALPSYPVDTTDSTKTSSNLRPPSTDVRQGSSTNTPQDTVKISSAGQAAANALKASIQEATETPNQTAQEARSGDRQAKKLLAKEEAAKEAAAKVSHK